MFVSPSFFYIFKFYYGAQIRLHRRIVIMLSYIILIDFFKD